MNKCQFCCLHFNWWCSKIYCHISWMPNTPFLIMSSNIWTSQTILNVQEAKSKIFFNVLDLWSALPSSSCLFLCLVLCHPSLKFWPEMTDQSLEKKSRRYLFSIQFACITYTFFLSVKYKHGHFSYTIRFESMNK